MKITAEIDVKFDEGFYGMEVDSIEIREAIADAISACAEIENVASVEVKKLKIKY